MDPAAPLKTGNQWGVNDAVEIAVRNPAAGQAAPILVLRGFPSGHVESSDEAGAPSDAVGKAGAGTTYAARIVDDRRWTAEWRVAFAALGIDPARHARIRFNLSVRKTADAQWLMWQGTGGCTWQVDGAGFIELVR